MAAPKFTPVGPIDVVRSYDSPDHVPDPWLPQRPAEIDGRQPAGQSLGYQGPDQGYVLSLAERFGTKVRGCPPEAVDDAVQGCMSIALKRASLFGRAPVIHDLTIAFTIWGWLDDSPDNELVWMRKKLFEGVHNTDHHYLAGRLIADLVPVTTLQMTPGSVSESYAAGKWKELTGAGALDGEAAHT